MTAKNSPIQGHLMSLYTRHVQQYRTPFMVKNSPAPSDKIGLLSRLRLVSLWKAWQLVVNPWKWWSFRSFLSQKGSIQWRNRLFDKWPNLIVPKLLENLLAALKTWDVYCTLAIRASSASNNESQGFLCCWRLGESNAKEKIVHHPCSHFD